MTPMYSLARFDINLIRRIEYTQEDAINQAFKVVCKVWGLTPFEIKSKSKKRPIPYARGVLSILIKNYTNLSDKKIANEVGLSTHSSVLQARDNIFNLCEFDKVLKQIYEHCDRYMSSMFIKSEIKKHAYVGKIKVYIVENGKIKVFKSQTECAKYLGVKVKAVNNNIRGIRKLTKGHTIKIYNNGRN